MTPFHAEKCCHLVSAHSACERRSRDVAIQLLRISAAVIIFYYFTAWAMEHKITVCQII